MSEVMNVGVMNVGQSANTFENEDLKRQMLPILKKGFDSVE